MYISHFMCVIWFLYRSHTCGSLSCAATHPYFPNCSGSKQHHCSDFHLLHQNEWSLSYPKLSLNDSLAHLQFCMANSRCDTTKQFLINDVDFTASTNLFELKASFSVICSPSCRHVLGLFSLSSKLLWN